MRVKGEISRQYFCMPCTSRMLLYRRHISRHCTLTLSATMLWKAVKSMSFFREQNLVRVRWHFLPLHSHLKIYKPSFLFLQHCKIHVYVSFSTVSDWKIYIKIFIKASKCANRACTHLKIKIAWRLPNFLQQMTFYLIWLYRSIFAKMNSDGSIMFQMNIVPPSRTMAMRLL